MIRLGIGIAVSIICNLVPLLIPAEVMHKWYTSGSMILCLMGNVHLIIAYVYYLTRKEPFEDKAEKKSFERLAIWSFLGIFFSGVSIVGQIIRLLRNGAAAADIIILVFTAGLFFAFVFVFKAKVCVQPDERIWNKKEDEKV